MASTESRAGFRPPWALRSDSDGVSDGATGEAIVEDGAAGAVSATIAAFEAADAPGDESVAELTVAAEPAPPVPTKFQADLARAMRAAAESARTEAIDRLAVDSTARIEAIKTEVADAAAELRQRADDDIAGIRDWSKAEIARIRSETDTRIAGRKSELDHEIAEHEDTVRARIEAVTARVAAFEANLDAFFELLSREDDPTRIAVMAQALPEAPDLERIGADPTSSEAAPVASATVVESAVTEASVAGDDADPDEAAGDGSDEVLTDSEFTASVDRRLAAFGLAPTAAAEAEAEAEAGSDLPTVAEAASGDIDSAADAGSATTTEPEVVAEVVAVVAEVADPAGPAWGMAPTIDEAPVASPTDTTVVVEGLISVASIAGFKRNLSRLDGVSSVTVTSGPDGEFIFAVKHDGSATVEAGLPGMAGFGVRILEVADGTIKISAHDPETAADGVLDRAGSRG